jgi:hypothetical protein
MRNVIEYVNCDFLAASLLYLHHSLESLDGTSRDTVQSRINNVGDMPPFNSHSTRTAA